MDEPRAKTFRKYFKHEIICGDITEILKTNIQAVCLTGLYLIRLMWFWEDSLARFKSCR